MRPGVLRRARAVAELLWRCPWALLSSGLQTAVTLLRWRSNSSNARCGFVKLRFAPLTPDGVALMAALFALTPGTSVVEIDQERHELLLHLLDLDRRNATETMLRDDVEPWLLAWFGRSGDG